MILKKSAVFCGCGIMLFSQMLASMLPSSAAESEEMQAACYQVGTKLEEGCSNAEEIPVTCYQVGTKLQEDCLNAEEIPVTCYQVGTKLAEDLSTEHDLPDELAVDSESTDTDGAVNTDETETNQIELETSENVTKPDESETENTSSMEEDGNKLPERDGDTKQKDDRETEGESETVESGKTDVEEKESEAGEDTEKLSEKDTESALETKVEMEENMESTEAESKTESKTESDSETESEQVFLVPDNGKDSEYENDDQIDSDDAFWDYGETEAYMSRSSPYFWDSSWYLPEDFRFTQVAKEYALAKPEGNVLRVYSDSSGSGNIVGTIPYFGIAYILEEDGEWTYIESGLVRGFVQSRYLARGTYVDHVIEVLGEHGMAEGTATISAFANTAFTHTKTTVHEVVAEKQYGITLFTCDIKEYPKAEARAIGKAVSGNLVYILEVADNGWLYVESGDVRGFLDPALLLAGDTAEDLYAFNAEEIRFAEEVIQPQENQSLYYSFKSVKIAGCTLGREIAECAMGYVGKLPYVWGGTSLQSGADCSGFVQSVFASFGVMLPRLAQEQGANGMAVDSLQEAEAGDIVYYGSGPHVGIYIGNGMVVQCSGNSRNDSSHPGKGPTISSATYLPVTSIRRYLIETGAAYSDGGNRLDLTAYTQQQMELIWAVVAQEDNGSYEGALAVISSAMNRTESGHWGYAGENALSQLTSPGQYCYSLDTYWKSRLNGNVPEYVKAAVNDCLKRGIRNHPYTCFRSRRGKTTGISAVQIGGNWYFGV